MIRHDKAALFLATGCCVGNIPAAPGTLGTIVGLPVCYALSFLGLPALVMAVVMIIAVAVYVSGVAEKQLNRKDPGCVVIDEIAGIVITLFGLPFSPAVVITGFFLFRLLDVVKPYPISLLDRRLKGGIGIVSDDLAAGLVANLLLQWLLHLFPDFFA